MEIGPATVTNVWMLISDVWQRGQSESLARLSPDLAGRWQPGLGLAGGWADALSCGSPKVLADGLAGRTCRILREEQPDEDSKVGQEHSRGAICPRPLPCGAGWCLVIAAHTQGLAGREFAQVAGPQTARF